MAAELDRLAHSLGTATNSVRLLAHTAVFARSMRFALFTNVTNLSETADREITHIWVEAQPKVYVENARHSLPKRLGSVDVTYLYGFSGYARFVSSN